MKSNEANKSRIATGLVTLSLMAASSAAIAVPDQPEKWEKCAGIAKAGQNDCGAIDGSHACAGQSKTDLSDVEWVYVPEGTCEKIVGGVVYQTKPAEK